MGVMQRVVKPRSQKAKRALENREPKAIENPKEALFIKGAKCPQVVQDLMRDLSTLKKPHSQFLQKKNEILPFEDHTKLEFFAKKFDASLFVFGNSNKKRPNNLTLGRCYDYQLLDMVELGVTRYQGLAEFKNDKIASGTKPCLMFSGEFESKPELQRLKSLFIDFFRGPEVTNIRLAGLEHALQFTASKDGSTVFLRSYKILLKKSSTPKIPRVELEEIGPSVDFVLRRTHLASDDLFKTACKKVKNLGKVKKIKNREEDVFGNQLGVIHMESQNVAGLQTRKMKGLKLERQERLKEKREKAKKAREDRVGKVFGEEEEEEGGEDNDDEEGEDDDSGEEDMEEGDE